MIGVKNVLLRFTVTLKSLQGLTPNPIRHVLGDV
jgi:hypothetical protein